ncbi:chemotaxis protein CheA [Vallitalea okinawensis]|uniref:chemotaxis protein CheA n=1 Tax=Vallitalea okinawensis TaxID=2078660 RepID=UPI000CFB6DA6|nr:chemotaxis protein CheA [Vallitalea okinawensis]
MDMEQYLDIFIEEAKEHLQNLNESILELENNPEDENLINEIFRIAHTIKGMAGTMGFTKMQKLTHDMENVLSEIRNGSFKVTTVLIDVLFKSLDALEGYNEEIASTGSEGAEEHNDLIRILNEILEGTYEAAAAVEVVAEPVVEEVQTLEDEENEYEKKFTQVNFDNYVRGTVVQAKSQNFNFFGLTVYISPKCVLKSARAFVLFKALEEIGEIVKTIPEVQDIEDEKFDLDISLFVLTKESKEKVLSVVENLSEIEKVLIDEAEIKEEVVEKVVDKQATKEEKTVKEKKEKPKTAKTVRVDIERLDILMNLASELIIIKNSLENIDGLKQNSSFNESVEYLERITTNLHDAVMKVRMVPVEQVFNRFPRMVRDLSKKLNKEIKLEMSGKETELDRTVIDEIGDPLLHLLRNAADHGLETPGERVAKGKNKEGHMKLRAFQDGNNVLIEVKDDGKGINLDKIKEKAINNGLISSTEVENLKKEQIMDFLFMPSFSTAKEVTDVSGRGVGLDVVKTKIQALGGSIEVDTEPGKGSTFTIRLPLTLAIIQALMVNIGLEKYAVPLNTIQTIEKIDSKDIKMVQNNEVIILRNKVIPIIRLDEILHVKKDQEDQDAITVVIVKKGEKLAGFVVDDLIGQQEIVIKSLGKYLSNIKLIAGATILGDGEVALILDINSLV